MSRTSNSHADQQRFAVVYECPDCEQRLLDERRCPDCQLFCRRVDRGGNCPHCGEPVAITDLEQVPTGQEVSPWAR
ncbi:MAG: hypothetical protein M3353_09385 [Actinomycetota bacterium]|nr:hypothetical protein [Actinomycetota bacterium]